MKKLFVYILSAAALAACTSELEYDISDAPSVPVLSALWSTEDTDHIVYLTRSEAYTLSAITGEVDVRCYINGELSAVADSSWQETTSEGFPLRGFRLRATLQPGDSVRLSANMAGTVLSAGTLVVRPPEIGIDTVSVLNTDEIPPYRWRDYTLSCIVRDRPGERNYYRLNAASAYVEVWNTTLDRLMAARYWPYAFAQDDEDPVFKSIPVHFPQALSEDLPFLQGSYSNFTHVFSDEMFPDAEHVFLFDIRSVYSASFFPSEMEDVIYYDFHLPGGTVFNQVKPYVEVSVSALGEKEYDYMLAYNAFYSSGADPLAEPVILPDNVEGGMGFFGVESVARKRVALPERLFRYESALPLEPPDPEEEQP